MRSTVGRLKGYTSNLITVNSTGFPSLHKDIGPTSGPFTLFCGNGVDLLDGSGLGVTIVKILGPSRGVRLAREVIASRVVGRGTAVIDNLTLNYSSVTRRATLRGNTEAVTVLPDALSDVLPGRGMRLTRGVIRTKKLLVDRCCRTPGDQGSVIDEFIIQSELRTLFSSTMLLSTDCTPGGLKGSYNSERTVRGTGSCNVGHNIVCGSDGRRSVTVCSLGHRVLRRSDDIVQVSSTGVDRTILQLIAGAGRHFWFWDRAMLVLDASCCK